MSPPKRSSAILASVLQPIPLLLTLLGAFSAAPQEADPASAAALAGVAVPELRAEDLGAWRDRIRPAPGELAWDTIPWVPSFGDGVRRASREGRPLLFWAMNGHPLGCT